MKIVMTLTSVFRAFILKRGALTLVPMRNLTGTERGIGDQMATDRHMNTTSTQ